MAEDTGQALSSSSSISSSSSSAGVPSAPPAEGADQDGCNDENSFENRFNFMVEAVRKLQLDGLRVS